MIGTARSLLAAVVGLMALLALGCGRAPAVKVVCGSVACGGQQVPMGRITFVPVENASQPPSAATIKDGQYRMEAKGGVPLGKYRVQVDARRKTGRQVNGFNGFEMTRIDEEVRMGPEVYASNQSPLTLDIRADFSGQYDIVIPRQ